MKTHSNGTSAEDLGWKLLETCQRCRNSMMYLLRPPMSQPQIVRVMRSRLRSLPVRHESTHKDIVSADDNMPIMISLKDYPPSDN